MSFLLHVFLVQKFYGHTEELTEHKGVDLR